MNKSDNKKLYEAAKMLKDFCGSHKSCKECYFYEDHIDGSRCMIGENCPRYWDPIKPRRWTNEDIALAKALKAFGVVSVYKNSCVEIVIWESEVDNKRSSGDLPYGAFKSLKNAERVSIDDIIKESEDGDWLDKYL